MVAMKTVSKREASQRILNAIKQPELNEIVLLFSISPSYLMDIMLIETLMELGRDGWNADTLALSKQVQNPRGETQHMVFLMLSKNHLEIGELEFLRIFLKHQLAKLKDSRITEEIIVHFVKQRRLDLQVLIEVLYPQATAKVLESIILIWIAILPEPCFPLSIKEHSRPQSVRISYLLAILEFLRSSQSDADVSSLSIIFEKIKRMRRPLFKSWPYEQMVFDINWISQFRGSQLAKVFLQCSAEKRDLGTCDILLPYALTDGALLKKLAECDQKFTAAATARLYLEDQ